MEWIARLCAAMDRNKALKRLIDAITVALFPIFLVLVIEGIHLGSPGALAEFITGSFGVFLFDALLLAALLGVFTLLLRQVWLAMFIEGGVLYILSLVEYFKFDANGTHFSLADLVMAGKLSDVARFANVELSLPLVLPLALLVAYVLWAAFLRIRLDLRPWRRVAAGTGALLALSAFLAVPGIYQPVYSLFGVQYQSAYGPYAANETFYANQQIAYLSQNLSSELSRTFSTPDGYSEQSIEAMLPQTGSAAEKAFTAPDIVMIMSEAYADFRRFDGVPIPEGTYDQFDRLAREGGQGTAIVPTFGGYTCKTEFELLFGLPVKGIGDENIPHQLFTDGQPRPTFAAYLRELGYQTEFIHPFSSSFYNRDKAYQSYGFDRLRFEDDFTVDKARLGPYIDDRTLVNQIRQDLEQDSGKPKFIYAVSMQNHGPYDEDGGHAARDPRLTPSEQAELGRYLYGVGQTDQALGELAQYLRGRTRPTILLFVGDHYPYLGRQGAMYQKFGEQDPYSLYRQSFLLWSSDGRAISIPEEEVSAFYLPHLLGDSIHMPRDRFFSDMWQMMQETPVYTFDRGDQGPNAQALTNLAFDRTQGGFYSSDALRDTSRLSLKLLFSQLKSIL